MSIAQFSAAMIPYALSWLTLIALTISQILAVVREQEQPFPKSTISMKAGHYPQYVIFRISVQCSATMLIMTWFLHYFWLHTKFENVHIYKPKIFVSLGTIGGIALMATSATIDTGEYKNRLHVACAATFFIATIWASLYNCFLTTVVYLKTNMVSKSSIIMKVSVATMLVIWMILALFFTKLDQDLINFAEYGMTYLILVYVILMGNDMESTTLIIG